MTENKRYTTDNGSNEDVCLVDNVTGKEFESDFDEIVELLNEQEARINELKETIIKITHSYHRKHDNTIVNLVDEIYEEDIGDLFVEWNGDVE